MPEINDIDRVAAFAHMQSSAFKRKLAATQRLVLDNPSYCMSVSFGKDSNVMLHIAAQLLPNIDLFHVRYNDPLERLPDLDSIADQMLQICPNTNLHQSSCAGELDMYKKLGRFFAEAETSEQKALVAEFKRGFEAAISTLIGGYAGTFIGMRAGESFFRRCVVAKKGNHYDAAGRAYKTCLPLAYWSNQDIWAYTIAHNLPFLQIYKCADSWDDARSDFSFAVSGGAGRYGMYSGYKKSYPEWWFAICKQHPYLATLA